MPGDRATEWTTWGPRMIGHIVTIRTDWAHSIYQNLRCPSMHVRMLPGDCPGDWACLSTSVDWACLSTSEELTLGARCFVVEQWNKVYSPAPMHEVYGPALSELTLKTLVSANNGRTKTEWPGVCSLTLPLIRITKQSNIVSSAVERTTPPKDFLDATKGLNYPIKERKIIRFESRGYGQADIRDEAGRVDQRC